MGTKSPNRILIILIQFATSTGLIAVIDFWVKANGDMFATAATISGV